MRVDREQLGRTAVEASQQLARAGDEPYIEGALPKITFVGAESTVFAKNLLGDILGMPELADSEIALFDIDEERFRTSERSSPARPPLPAERRGSPRRPTAAAPSTAPTTW